MSRVKFEILNCQSSFLDPRKAFEEHTEEFQVRLNPLTGKSGHLSHFGAIKPQRLSLADYERPEIKGVCPFCLELRGKSTPRFVNTVLPEGRLIRGEATLIPNLYPYDVHSGVIIMTDDHVVPLEKLTDRRVSDALSLGVDFLQAGTVSEYLAALSSYGLELYAALRRGPGSSPSAVLCHPLSR